MREVEAPSLKHGDEIAILTEELSPTIAILTKELSLVIVEPSHDIDVSSPVLVLYTPRKTHMIDATNNNNHIDHIIHAALVK